MHAKMWNHKCIVWNFSLCCSCWYTRHWLHLAVEIIHSLPTNICSVFCSNTGSNVCQDVRNNLFRSFSLFPEAMVTCGRKLGLFEEKNRLYLCMIKRHFIRFFICYLGWENNINIWESKKFFLISYFRKFSSSKLYTESITKIAADLKSAAVRLFNIPWKCQPRFSQTYQYFSERRCRERTIS